MKIAAFTSNEGERARHLHEFFKEGNRISIERIYTDNPKATIIEKMRQEGIEVIVITPDLTGDRIAEELRKHDVELLVIDDFVSELPAEVKEAYGEAIVAPMSAQSAPLEVITTIDRLNVRLRRKHAEEVPAKEPAAEQPQESQKSKDGPATPLSDIDKEWADVLDVDVEAPQPTEQPADQPEQPTTPPEYVEAPRPQNPYGPQPPYETDQVGDTPPEPMPKTYLLWSVIITLLCCIIPGVIAIIYSASVSSKYYRGDIEGAKRASRNAQIWCIVSIVAGIIWATLYFPLSIFIP